MKQSVECLRNRNLVELDYWSCVMTDNWLCCPGGESLVKLVTDGLRVQTNGCVGQIDCGGGSRDKLVHVGYVCVCNCGNRDRQLNVCVVADCWLYSTVCVCVCVGQWEIGRQLLMCLGGNRDSGCVRDIVSETLHRIG